MKIAYSTNGTNWTEVAATAGADGTYTATGANFAAEKNYTYKLVVNGADAGKALTHQTAAGAQIPNGDMESWSDVGGVIYPYAAGASPFWLTGNDVLRWLVLRLQSHQQMSVQALRVSIRHTSSRRRHR